VEAVCTTRVVWITGLREQTAVLSGGALARRQAQQHL
jgi:hypothetical protein